MSGTSSVVSSDPKSINSLKDCVADNVLNDWACSTFSPSSSLTPEQNQFNLTLRLALAFEDHSEWQKNVTKDQRKGLVCTAYVLELTKDVYPDQGIVFVMRRESSDLKSRNDHKVEYQAVLANVRGRQGGQGAVHKIFLRGLDAKEIFEVLDVRDSIVEKVLALRTPRGTSPWRLNEDYSRTDLPQKTTLTSDLMVEGKPGEVVLVRTTYNTDFTKNASPAENGGSEAQYEVTFTIPSKDSSNMLVVNFHATKVRECFEEIPN